MELKHSNDANYLVDVWHESWTDRTRDEKLKIFYMPGMMMMLSVMIFDTTMEEMKK